MKNDIPNEPSVFIYPWDIPLIQQFSIGGSIYKTQEESYLIAMHWIIAEPLLKDASTPNVSFFFIPQKSYLEAKDSFLLENFFLDWKRTIVSSLSTEKMQTSIAIVTCSTDVAKDLGKCFEPGVDTVNAQVFDINKTTDWIPLRIELEQIESEPKLKFFPVERKEVLIYS